MEKSHCRADFHSTYKSNLLKKLNTLTYEQRTLFLPQGSFVLVYDEYNVGCSACQCFACRISLSVLSYPVCAHFAEQIGLGFNLHFILKYNGRCA